MRGRHPKPRELRKRRNKEQSPVLLTPEAEPLEGTPELGPHPRSTEEQPVVWHPRTVEWWEDTWSSPQAEQYLTVDVHGLYRLAVLIDLFWRTGDPKVSSEIRLVGERYGQSPLDRFRLRWETVRTEDAERKRKPEPEAPASTSSADDPRRGLAAV